MCIFRGCVGATTTSRVGTAHRSTRCYGGQCPPYKDSQALRSRLVAESCSIPLCGLAISGLVGLKQRNSEKSFIAGELFRPMGCLNGQWTGTRCSLTALQSRPRLDLAVGFCHCKGCGGYSLRLGLLQDGLETRPTGAGVGAFATVFWMSVRRRRPLKARCVSVLFNRAWRRG